MDVEKMNIWSPVFINIFKNIFAWNEESIIKNSKILYDSQLS
jgi:hypothetical protein